MRGLKVFIKSYGCQMNIYDSNKMRDILCAQGCKFVDDYSSANIVILNTCSIREKAEDKLFSDLGRIRPYKELAKKSGSTYIIVVAGCISQLRKDSIIKKANCVDIVIGPQMIQHISKLISLHLQNETSKNVLCSFNGQEKFSSFDKTKSTNFRVSEFVTIQEGCDNFCTYCIVPHTRGREISRSVDSVLREVCLLADAGVKEIVLLGQNVNSYHGLNRYNEQTTLASLIRKISQEVPHIRRIRYVTSYPNDMTDELISAFCDIDVLMPFLHLPVQSGSTRILQAMNRKYSAEYYIECIEKIRKMRPDIAFSSDFIVGFPGETDEDFSDTIKLVNHVKFAQAYSFKYSPRPYTKAATMDDQVPDIVKEERLAILQSILDAQQKDFNQQTVGKTVNVLLEKLGKYQDQLIGKTEHAQAVTVTQQGHSSCKVGDIVRVKITNNLSHSLYGEVESVV